MLQKCGKGSYKVNWTWKRGITMKQSPKNGSALYKGGKCTPPIPGFLVQKQIIKSWFLNPSIGLRGTFECWEKLRFPSVWDEEVWISKAWVSKSLDFQLLFEWTRSRIPSPSGDVGLLSWIALLPYDQDWSLRASLITYWWICENHCLFSWNLWEIWLTKSLRKSISIYSSSCFIIVDFRITKSYHPIWLHWQRQVWRYFERQSRRGGCKCMLWAT